MMLRNMMMAVLIGLVPVILMSLIGYVLFGALGAYVCAFLVPASFLIEYGLEQFVLKLLHRRRNE